jgi:succinate dehydrogenase/fumarate reductase cytochrome b subunit
MMMSIVHRITGAALYRHFAVGLRLLAAVSGLARTVSTCAAASRVSFCSATPGPRSISAWRLRYLIWDTGHGLGRPSAAAAARQFGRIDPADDHLWVVGDT